jgi:hypothetical protein
LARPFGFTGVKFSDFVKLKLVEQVQTGQISSPAEHDPGTYFGFLNSKSRRPLRIFRLEVRWHASQTPKSNRNPKLPKPPTLQRFAGFATGTILENVREIPLCGPFEFVFLVFIGILRRF